MHYSFFDTKLIKSTINEFIRRANVNDSTRADLSKYSIEGLKIDSWKGGQQIPKVKWLGFFGKGQTPSSGIYPVYLYYRYNDDSRRVLILSYGISAKGKAKYTWPESKIETSINKFFDNKCNEYFGNCNYYGDSFVYKVYEVKGDEVIAEDQVLFKDLMNLLKIYHKTLSDYRITNLFDLTNITQSEPPSQIDPPLVKSPETQENIKFSIDSVIETLKNTGLIYEDFFIKRFVYSLLTKPFVIFSGLSGSGKTQLALAFANAICENVEEQLCFVAVGSDWTNREPLLGYPDALNRGVYVKPENGALDLIINAGKNPEKPYFLILDEMNLSYVERYFADFLSAMESKKQIALWTTDNKDVPKAVSLPPNLFIIGTINVDETTYMFSPKVLDRANVIEFNVSESNMKSFLDNYSNINIDQVKGKIANMGNDFIEIAGPNIVPS